MKGCLIVGGVALLALVLVGGCGVGKYNDIVGRETQVDASWSEIHNQYQRRAELVPQLVATVKGAAEFEQATLTELTEARASVGKVELPATLPDDPAKLEAYLQAQERLSNALSRLIAVAENYPELKATQGFLTLQSQLEGTENRIAVARRDYIDAVREFNTAITRFPGSLVASVTGRKAKPQLEVPAGATEPPKVDFDFSKPASQPK